MNLDNVAQYLSELDPQLVDTTVSSLCSTGRPPLVMTGIFLWVLRKHFFRAGNIVDSTLKEYLWNSDPKQTQIVIEPATSWTPANIQKLGQRPGIYIKRGNYTPGKLGIRDQYMGTNRVDNLTNTGNNVSDVNASKFEVLISGEYAVLCVAGQGAEAEALGAEVFFNLLEFKQVIRTDMGLNKFEIQGAGAATKLEEAHEHWVVPVGLSYVFNHAWQVTEYAPALKSVLIMEA